MAKHRFKAYAHRAKHYVKTHGKEKLKVTGITMAEVGTLAVGTVAAKKFLDFEVMFPNVDKEKFFIKHQGLVKFVAFAGAAAWVENPWAKLFLIGLSLEGFIREARVITTNKEGVSFFGQIGKATGANGNAMNQAMLDAARAAGGSALPPGNPALGTNPTTQYPTFVGQSPSVDLQNNSMTYVSGMGMAGADNFGNF